MHEQPVALVTGANKGIGLQIAKDLAAHGMTVLVGSRDAARGEAAAASIEGDARAIPLDVTRSESITAAAACVHETFGRLDVLVNNAGIAHAGDAGCTLADIVRSGRASVASPAEMRAVFETNVFGVVAVTQAMLPLLRAAPAGRIVNLSSGRASLTLASDPLETRRRAMFGVIYAASKAALNAVTLAFALDLEHTRIKVNAAAPGFTLTDMNHGEGRQTVEQAARVPVRLALLDEAGPTGGFFDEHGPLPW